MKKKLLALTLCAAFLLFVSAHAEESKASADHAAHTAQAAETPATKEYMESHHKMMKDMMVKPTGDSDKDFAAMMIPHHQGAIDMAKTELKYGKDPELRKLAEDIVKAQETEIKFMKEWLEKHK